MKIRNKADARRLAVQTQLKEQDKLAPQLRQAPNAVTRKPHPSRDWYPAN